MTERMRICHFGPETPALSQTFVYREALALKARGHEVFVATVRRPKNPAANMSAALGPIFTIYDGGALGLLKDAALMAFARPFSTLKTATMAAGDLFASAKEGRFKPALLMQFLGGLRLARFLRRNKIDHLHVHFAHFPTQIAMYATSVAGAPFTAMAHANDIFENALLLKQKSKRAAALLMISQFNFDALREEGVEAGAMKIVRCGVPLRRRAHPAPEWRARPFRVGSLGRLVEKKGMATTIRSFALLRDMGVDAVLEIVGDGPLERDLKAEIAALGLEGRVVMLGTMQNEQALSWLESLHVFAMACQKDAQGDMDGVPVSMMEAMAIGAPVVSTRISGVPELVIDGVSGLLCAPENPAGLAEAIARCAGDEALYRKLVAGARARIEEEFSEEVNVARLEAIIREAGQARAS